MLAGGRVAWIEREKGRRGIRHSREVRDNRDGRVRTSHWWDDTLSGRLDRHGFVRRDRVVLAIRERSILRRPCIADSRRGNRVEESARWDRGPLRAVAEP